MRFKYYKRKIFGVELNSAEQKAMNIEINRQLVEKDKQYAKDIDAMVLYALMVHTGWKKKRLRNFWKDFNKIHKELRAFYETESPGDNVWLAHRMLKEIGVDVQKWYEEETE